MHGSATKSFSYVEMYKSYLLCVDVTEESRLTHTPHTHTTTNTHTPHNTYACTANKQTNKHAHMQIHPHTHLHAHVCARMKVAYLALKTCAAAANKGPKYTWVE